MEYKAFITIVSGFFQDEEGNALGRYLAVVFNSAGDVVLTDKQDFNCSGEYALAYAATPETVRNKIKENCQSFYSVAVDEFLFLSTS